MDKLAGIKVKQVSLNVRAARDASQEPELANDESFEMEKLGGDLNGETEEENNQHHSKFDNRDEMNKETSEVEATEADKDLTKVDVGNSKLEEDMTAKSKDNEQLCIEEKEKINNELSSETQVELVQQEKSCESGEESNSKENEVDKLIITDEHREIIKHEINGIIEKAIMKHHNESSQ